MKSDDVVIALRNHFQSSATERSHQTGFHDWALLTEVLSYGLSAPYWDLKLTPEELERRIVLSTLRSIDVMLMRNTGGRERYAIEIKVSRADFFRETPAKRLPWELLTHRFIYAVPRGLVQVSEVPQGCFLLEIDEEKCDDRVAPHRNCKNGGTQVHWNKAVKGVKRKPEPLSPSFTNYLIRRLSYSDFRYPVFIKRMQSKGREATNA